MKNSDIRLAVFSLFIIVFIHASASFDRQSAVYHARKITDSAYRYQIYFAAAQQNDEIAQETLRALALRESNTYWLGRLMDLGDGLAAYQHYKNNPEHEDALTWLLFAAKKNVSAAQYQYALIQDNASQKELWLNRAAQAEFPQAMVALADWLMLNNKLEDAKYWLNKAALFDDDSRYQLAHMLWREGEKEHSKRLFSIAARHNHKAATQFAQIINNYKQYSTNSLPNIQFENSCRQNIAMIANELTQMEHAVSLRNAFNLDKRFSDMGICLAKPLWLEQPLSCDLDRYNHQKCNLSSLAAWFDNNAVSHAIIITDNSIAYTQQGVMVLDLGDAYTVMVHELAHFAGFVDEYPLPKRIADEYCSSIHATNLLFETDNGFMLAPNSEQRLQLWAQDDSFTRLAPARTCEYSTTHQAYKPSLDITFMEYHDSNNIPDLYLNLWDKVLDAQRGERPIAR